MGNIVLLQSTHHTAIFGFLVGAIVDIAGQIFGLGIYMWLVGGVCTALLRFFWHLDELNRRYYGGEEAELPTVRSEPSAQLELPSDRQEAELATVSSEPSVRQELLENRVPIV